MLALSFLLLIGVTLIAEGIDLHIPKGYIYFAMAFSVMVEMLNIRIRGAHKPVQLEEERSLAFGPPTAAQGERHDRGRPRLSRGARADLRHLGRGGRCTKRRITGPTSSRWGTWACLAQASCCRSC